MRITHEGIYGYVHYSSSEEREFQALRNEFSVLDPDRFMRKEFRRRKPDGTWTGWWDGRHHVITEKKGEFLRGLTDQILAAAKRLRIKIECDQSYNFIDQQRFAKLAPNALVAELAGIKLADHQRRMVKSLLENGGGTVEGVTGCGKTESIALLAKILNPEVNVIFVLVHMIGLMEQAFKRVVKRAPDLAAYCGMLGDGNRPRFCAHCKGRGWDPADILQPCPACDGKVSHRIIFSTQQSLSSVLGLSGGRDVAMDESVFAAWESVGAVFIDECHHVSQPQYQKLLSTLGEVPIFQFSGTPEVDNPILDWNIVGVGGPIVERVKRKELEKTGFIAQAVACIRVFEQPFKKNSMKWMPEKLKVDQVVKVWVVGEDGQVKEELRPIEKNESLKSKEDERLLLPNYARDHLIVNLERNLDIISYIEACLKIGRKPLVLCERVAQACYLRGLIEEHSPYTFQQGVGLIHGSHSLAQRNQIKKEFETDKINVILSSSIFDEGEDLERVGAMVLAGGGSSLVRMVQRTGRGVRKKDGLSNWCPVWFPCDNVNAFAKEHTVTRLTYLDRAEITSELIEGTWEHELTRLEDSYGQSLPS